QTARDIRLLRDLARLYAQDGRPFFATPFFPGAYAVLERNSPVWEIYATVPRSAAFEEAEIERLKKASPGFVIINYGISFSQLNLHPFQQTHERLYRYVTEHFDRIDDPSYPMYEIFSVRT